MTIEDRKEELITEIKFFSLLRARAIVDNVCTYDPCSIEDYGKKLVSKLSMFEIEEICKTWPTCYEERVEIFSERAMIDEALRTLAMEILLNESSVPMQQAANG